MGEEIRDNKGLEGQRYNRAKPWQILLFAFNNGATNIYYILIMNYIAYYANGVLGLVLMFATTMVTVMRVFDAVINPLVGILVDKTQTKFGKFRPFMLLGNLILFTSAIIMFFGLRLIPETQMVFRYVSFVLVYLLYVIGYTFQTSVTRSGQTTITNDPKQRPLFNMSNAVASGIGMGATQVMAVLVGGRYGFGSVEFFDIVIPIGITLSVVLTILAVIGIWEKDVPENWGIGGTDASKINIKETLAVFKENKELRMLITAGASTKLAFAVATNMTVAVMLFGSMMGNYNELYLPIFAFGYIVSVPFFIGNAKTSQKEGQKASLVKYTKVALLFYVGIVVLLILWQPWNPDTMLSFSNLNLYTIIFLVIYGVGYGAYFSIADMAIPMSADVSDYETYRTGNYRPGTIGTMFSFVDGLVTSLAPTIVGIGVTIIGLETLPDAHTPYLSGMKTLVIFLFAVLPMLAWILTLIAMKKYTLTGERMEEIQAVNYQRKEAINNGMDVKEAMNTFNSKEDIDKNISKT